MFQKNNIKTGLNDINTELQNCQQLNKTIEDIKNVPKLKKKKKTFRKLHDLKLAFSEFYLSLILLQNYQTLNFTGFRKILKKHDKVCLFNLFNM